MEHVQVQPDVTPSPRLIAVLAVGDRTTATGMVELYDGLKRGFPEAPIFVITTPDLRDIAEKADSVYGIYTVSNGPGLLLDYLRRLVATPFDLYIDLSLRRTFASSFLAYGLKAKRRLMHVTTMPFLRSVDVIPGDASVTLQERIQTVLEFLEIGDTTDTPPEQHREEGEVSEPND